MIYVFHGQDSFRAREGLRSLRAELDRDGNLSLNTVRLDGATLSSADLRNACQTASFFADVRLVIVEGLLGRMGGGRRGRRAQSAADVDLNEFLEVLNSVPETTVVALIEEKVSEAALGGLGKDADVLEFGILKGEELRRWVWERIKSLNADFSGGALQHLLSLIDGYHLAELASEIDKLATYAFGRQILQEDVDALVSAAVQMQTWDLTDAVIEGRAERAMSVLRAMNAKDHPAQLLIFMIIRQFRQLLLAQAFLKEGLGSAQIGEELGIRSRYPLQKVIGQASRYPADRLESAYRLLLATDLSVKTGGMDADTALDALVVELAGYSRSQAARPAARA